MTNADRCIRWWGWAGSFPRPERQTRARERASPSPPEVRRLSVRRARNTTAYNRSAAHAPDEAHGACSRKEASRRWMREPGGLGTRPKRTGEIGIARMPFATAGIGASCMDFGGGRYRSFGVPGGCCLHRAGFRPAENPLRCRRTSGRFRSPSGGRVCLSARRKESGIARQGLIPAWCFDSPKTHSC